MSFSFHLRAAPTSGVRALHASTVTLAAAGFALAAWLGPPAWAGAWIGGGVAACWAAWRYGGRRLSWGRLIVDESGDGRWEAQDDAAAEGARTVRIERWCATERLVWLRLAETGDGGRRDTLIARDACSAEQWRCLRAWLNWLGRG